MAVINLPGVAHALVNAGFNVVGDGLADTKTTIDLVRDMNRDKEQLVVIIAINEPSLRMWATLQAAVDVPVLIVRSEVFPGGDGIPKTRNIELPISVNALMGVFGAPPADELEVEIGIDGHELGPDGSSVEFDNFDVFATKWGAVTEKVSEPPATETPRHESEPVATASENIFAPAEEPSPAQAEQIAAPSSSKNIFANTEPIAPAPADDVFAVDSTRPVFAPPDIDPEPIFESTREEPVFAPEPEPEIVRSMPHIEEPRRDDAAPSVFVHTQPSQSRTRERLGEICFVFAGKGGATKSTTTGALAERGAVVVPGLRDVVIDLSRAQGAQRSLLRLNDVDAPSMYDAAISNNPNVFRDVLIKPKRLTALRGNLPPLNYGVMLSPPKHQADKHIVTSSVYARAIEFARREADLVFIDTQTIEAKDSSGLIDEVVIPLLIEGAWGLGLSDSSTEGVENLEWILKRFAERDISSSRLMVAFNRVSATTVLNPDAITARFTRYATWMGAVMYDPAIESAHGTGDVPASADYIALLDRVLYRMTGIASFASKPSAMSNKNTSTSKRRFRRRA